MAIIKLTHLRVCAQNVITLALPVLAVSSAPVAILQNLELQAYQTLLCASVQMGTMILGIKFVLFVPIIASHAQTLLPVSLVIPALETLCKIANASMVSMMTESTMLVNLACRNV